MPEQNFHIGYIGLGKMGSNMVERLCEMGHIVSAYDPAQAARDRLANIDNATAYDNYQAMIETLPAKNRIIWVMVPSSVTTEVITTLSELANTDDVIIDGGNTNYQHTLEHHKLLLKRQINFIDVGVSGGPTGARTGACMMIGGDKDIFDRIKKLFIDLTVSDGYEYVGPVGSGHFVKMIHNGIEYGMMQAIAEGFNLLHKADFDIDLSKVAKVYNHGSVIQSALINWLYQGYQKHGQNLESIKGSVDHSGEGQWTVDFAKRINQPAEIIERSLEFRKKSTNNPSYTGQVLSTLRNEFGGHHAIIKTDDEA